MQQVRLFEIYICLIHPTTCAIAPTVVTSNMFGNKDASSEKKDPTGMSFFDSYGIVLTDISLCKRLQPASSHRSLLLRQLLRQQVTDLYLMKSVCLTTIAQLHHHHQLTYLVQRPPLPHPVQHLQVRLCLQGDTADHLNNYAEPTTNLFGAKSTTATATNSKLYHLAFAICDISLPSCTTRTISLGAV